MTDIKDKRQKPPFPLAAREDDKNDLVSRAEAAQILQCSVRTVTRYANEKFLLKYVDSRGRVMFSRRQCRAMVRFEQEDDTEGGS